MNDMGFTQSWHTLYALG